MRADPRARLRPRLLTAVGLSLALGCSSLTGRVVDTPPRLQTADPLTVIPATLPPPNRPLSAEVVPTAAVEPADPVAGAAGELSEAELVRHVLARNPTVARMTAAAQAAAARYPQVTSLDDPKVGAFVGPQSVFSERVNPAYRVEISQAIPFPGKLALRGEGAAGEAVAAGSELADARLQLAEAARAAFADYFVAARAAEVNEEALGLLRGFRENAQARYRTGQGEQQDVLQADVAIVRQSERSFGLDRARRVAQARINTLLNLPPDQPLPPPPKELAAPPALPPAGELRELAGNRPDLAAVRARLAADEAAVALALKEYYPDVEAMATYDTFWEKQQLRPMVGLRVNLPVRLDRRDAAVAEAQARLAQRRAELDRLTAHARLQVQEAFEQAQEADRALKLYEETALPAARENVRLARVAYANNKVPFLNLLEAQRNLVELRDREYQLRAEARRRRAALDRATGTGAAPEAAALPGPSSR